MRLVEFVSLNDVLKGSQYLKLLRHLSTSTDDLNVTRIKNQVITSWSKGMKARKHYDDLLSKVEVNLNDLID